MAFKALQGKATRRDVIKGTLKAGAYAAPLVVAGALPLAVGAVTGIGGVQLFINGSGAANTTIPFGNAFTVSGRGFQPNSVLYRSIASNAGTFTFLPITTDGNGNFTNVINTATSTEISTVTQQQSSTTFAIVISNTQPIITAATNGPNGPNAGSIPGVLVQTNVTVTGGPSNRAVGGDQ